MKIIAVTPTSDASSPLHPDHDRWVKERTFAMEVAHAQRAGLSIRHAESENARLLQIAENRARYAKPAKPAPKRKDREQRAIERGVTVRHAGPEATLQSKSPCGRCGVCRRCRCEKRVFAILLKRKEDSKLAALGQEMFTALIHASTGVGRFRGMHKPDINRIVAALAESVCDRSVRWLGEWK